MNSEEQARQRLISALTRAMSGKKAENIEQGDFIRLRHEAHKQTVDLLVFSAMSSSEIPPEETVVTENLLKGALVKNVRLWEKHVNVYRLLESGGIPCVILKGCAGALYYPDCMLKRIGDVDFIVPPDLFDKADRLLVENGFKPIHGHRKSHISYSFSGTCFELHNEPPGLPYGRSGQILFDALKDIFDRAVVRETPFGEMKTPCDFHHGLIVAMHNAHHLTSDGLGLRQLCDWAAFLTKADDRVLEQMGAVLRESGLYRFARVMSCAAERLTGCPCRFPLEEGDEALTDLLTEDIFTGGNFGQNSPDRAGEMLFTASTADSPVAGKPMGKRLIRSMNDIVRSKWKASKKIPLLLPVGWAVFGTRYLYRSLKGKRAAVRPVKIVSNSSKRISFYEKLGLYRAE